MGGKRRLILVCIVAVVLVTGVGLARARTVRSAERAAGVQAKVVLEAFEARKSELIGRIFSGGSLDPSMLEIDQTALHRAQRHTTSTNTTWAFLAAGTLLIACAAIAYETQSIWPPLLMGAYGWLVSAYAVALTLRYAAALYAGLLSEATVESPLPFLASGRLPFTFMLLAGLSSTFFWQSALPCALGTFVGLRIRVWRLSSDFVGPYHEVVLDVGGDSTRGIGVAARGATATETGED